MVPNPGLYRRASLFPPHVQNSRLSDESKASRPSRLDLQLVGVACPLPSFRPPVRPPVRPSIRPKTPRTRRMALTGRVRPPPPACSHVGVEVRVCHPQCLAVFVSTLPFAESRRCPSRQGVSPPQGPPQAREVVPYRAVCIRLLPALQVWSTVAQCANLSAVL